MRRKSAAGAARPADPCAFVIFGASGDLTHRLVFPALYNLAADGLLPQAFALIGVARKDMSSDAFRAGLEKSLREFATRPVQADVVRRLVECVEYVSAGADDPQAYERLGDALATIERSRRTLGNRLFYLATPPDLFAVIGCHLGRSGLARAPSGAWRRVIVEKPFGADLDSARALNAKLLSVLDEDQIYRIDHYLGKETVQNILALRFANGLFEPIWNRDHIDHVQITVAESKGIGRRGRFYDSTGALRDMVPNHLFQLLAIVAMEPPARFEAGAVRAEKTELLEAVQEKSVADALDDSVRAQYRAGHVANEAIGDYRGATDVSPNSDTETYVALKLHVDNWRWAGVPFYLRTGKALKAQASEVAIKFKQAPFAMFRGSPVDHLAQNFLVLGIRPCECISLEFNAKVPGPSITLAGVAMSFDYEDYFEAAPATGYETLIYDCMIGDAMLFQGAAGIEAGWRIVQPLLDGWRDAGARGLAAYEAGSEGPDEAGHLLARDARAWRPIAPALERARGA